MTKRKPLSPVEEKIKAAWTPRRVTYKPQAGAFETSTTLELEYHGYENRWGQQEHRDPILTPIFTAILGTGGFTLFGTTVSFASIASAITVTALTIGLQYATAPKPPTPEDGKAPKAQATPYRIWGVGTDRIAGNFMLWEESGGDLLAIQALAGHEISSFVGFYLNDDLVTLNDDTVDPDTGADASVVTGADGRYNGDHVRIFYRKGVNPETPYSKAVDDLSGESIWTENHRGDGQASVMMVCKSPDAEEYQETFPYGIPQLSAVMNMAKVWDFRDEEQDPDDPSTWAFSKNSILILCWHECFNEFGTRRDYTKAVLPVLELWKDEADICDEPITRASGGTEPRYECNGWDTAQNDPKAGTNAILGTCDGWLCERGDGALIPIVGKFREEMVGVLTDEDICGYRIEDDVRPAEEINRLIPKFTYPAADYTTTTTSYFQDTAAQLIAGRPLAEEGNYLWVHEWRQARRLAKRDWLRLQEKVKGNFNLNLCAFNAIYYRWLRIESTYEVPDLNGVLIENRRSLLSLMRGGLQMDWIKHPEDIDAWTPAEDEGAVPPVPVRPTSSGLPTPTIENIAAIAENGSVYIRAIIEQPERSGLTPYVKYRIKDIGGGTPGAWVEQGFPGIEAYEESSVWYYRLNTNPVPNDQVLEVQVAFRATKGKYSVWAPEPAEEINALADTIAPDLVTDLDVVVTDGTATVTFTTPNNPSTKLRSIRVYRAPAADTFPTNAVDVSGQRNVSALQDVTFVDDVILPSTASYKWHVVTENNSGVQSVPASSDAETAGYDTDALAYFAAADVMPNAARRAKFSALAAGLKADSTWTLIKSLGLWEDSESEANALLDFRDPTHSYVNNGAAWSAAGFTGNASSAYVDTGKTPGGFGQSQNDATYGIGITGGTDTGNDSAPALGIIGTPANPLFVPRTAAGGTRIRIGGTTNVNIGTVATILHDFIVTRRGSTDLELYIDGASAATSATASAALGTNNIVVFRNAATYSNFRASWVLIGLGMTDADAAAVRARLVTFFA